MKVCPVCQYEEEQEDEVSCAICGSDLESEGSVVEEISAAEPSKIEESLDITRSCLLYTSPSPRD